MEDIEDYISDAEEYCEKIKEKIYKVNDINFFKKVREKGNIYYKENRVKELEKIDSITYRAVVIGTEEYEVFVDMKGRCCKDTRCTCPFNKPTEPYINIPKCKHIYAVEKAIYEKENVEYLNSIIPEYLEKYKKEIISLKNKSLLYKLTKRSKKKYDELIKSFDKLENITIENLKTAYKAENIISVLENYITKSAYLLSEIETLFKDLEENECIYEDIYEDIKKDEYGEDYENEKKSNSIGEFLLDIFSDFIFGMFSGIKQSLFPNSSNIEYYSSLSDKKALKLNYGDRVYIRNSRIGIIVGEAGPGSYLVKMTNEFGEEYVESFSIDDLSK